MITLIVTVLNEGESIHHLMQSFLEQTRRPDEIVIVDGGSKDDTIAVLQRYADKLPLRVLVERGCSISAGRNVAICAAKGDIIAVTDAGVKLTPGWLEHITQPFFDKPDIQVVAGFFQADPHTAFEIAMSATVLPLHDEINPMTFLPSSRSVAFRKSAWEAVGGYPEWLDYSEDLIFDLRLKQIAPNFVFVPEALVHFRPRGSLRAFFKQYYLYARGDGKADLWRKRHLIRYATYLVAAPLTVLLGLAVNPLLWLLFIPSAAVYLYQPYRRLSTILKSSPKITLFGICFICLLIPIIRVVGDVAKMLGYPVGWRWRQTHNSPDWRQATR